MTVTLDDKTQLVVPPSVQRRAGLKAGDRLEFKVSGDVISITPKRPSADDEYTPEQRRAIDAGIQKGMEDFKTGRFHGPFPSAKEASAYIERIAQKRAATGKSKRPRR